MKINRQSTFLLACSVVVLVVAVLLTITVASHLFAALVDQYAFEADAFRISFSRSDARAFLMASLVTFGAGAALAYRAAKQHSIPAKRISLIAASVTLIAVASFMVMALSTFNVWRA